MQLNRDDPNLCYYVDHFKLSGCPFRELSADGRATRVYNFCAKCLDKHEEEHKVTKEKKVKYYFSIEKFQFMCDLKMIDGDAKEIAFEWTTRIANWANEAPELQHIETRRKRFERLRKLKEQD